MKPLAMLAIAFSFAGLANPVLATDKASPSGIWKQTISTNGRKSVTTYRLKVEGNNLTGTVGGREEIAIEEGKYDNGKISFKLVHWQSGTRVTAYYTGRMRGDTITGKI